MLFYSSLLQKNRKIKTQRTVILPVVLYGCEVWSVTLKVECILRVFENSVLRKVFGPERDEVTGDWQRLCMEKIYSLYSSPNVIRVIKPKIMRWTGHVARVGKEEIYAVFWSGNLKKEATWKT